MTKEKLLDFGRANLTRLLLLAVLLTGGLALNRTARARYLGFLYDYTSVVAGSESYFSSDYLFEASEGKTISTQLWQGDTFELPITLRNYSNALLYNHKGTNIYYYLEGAMYSDEACTTVDSLYTVSFEATDARVVGTTTVNGTQFKVYCLYGNDSFEQLREHPNEIRVKSSYAGNANELKDQFTRYLKVSAYTVPSTSVTFTNSDAQAIAGSADTQEVFYHSLQTVFSLTKVKGSGELTADWKPVSSNTDYAVELQIYTSGTSTNSTAATYVRVFYRAQDTDGAYLKPDTQSPGYDATGVDGLHSYVSATVYPGQVQSVLFYKFSLGQQIKKEDFAVVVSTDDSILTKEFNIKVVKTEHGSIQVQKVDSGGTRVNATTATYQTPIYVTLTPEDGYRIEALTIATEAGAVQSTEISSNVFQFDMTASDITISCTFTNAPIESNEEPDEEEEDDTPDEDDPTTGQGDSGGSSGNNS